MRNLSLIKMYKYAAFKEKIPFSWQDRRPLFLEKQFFYLPDSFNDNQAYYDFFEQKTPFLNRRSLICLEYCSGNGEWIIDRARRYPFIHWIAIEKRFKRACQIYSRMRYHALHNIFVVCGEGHMFTKYYLKNHSIQALYMNFPDPWPKRRHSKHRLIRKEFIEELKRISQPLGYMTLVTDDDHYLDQIKKEVALVNGWEAIEVGDEFKESYGSSFFRSLWQSKGLDIYFLCYRKKAWLT